jgi:hypothetical protein
MEITTEQHLDDGVLERRIVIDDVPGILWTPPSAAPAPLILVGHPGGLDRLYPRVAARARHYAATYGFAAVTIELPGSGDRPRLPHLDDARADLRRALGAGEPVDTIVEALIPPLVEAAVPEWQATMDDALALPEIGGPVAIDGGVLGVGVGLALADPRIAAAVLFAGSYVPRSMIEAARALTIPVQVLLQWDDQGNDRQLALDLYDAFGSAEKSLHANVGGHTGVPHWEMEAGARFFVRHLT